MPAKLYVKGRLPAPERRTVAVIGARMCSPYGRMQAFRYAKALSEAGVQIISGMALGIDSEGHKGALEGKMPTFAVLGSGVDVCYPKSNRKLYERILWENGGSSVNVHWVPDLFPGIFRRETGSSVLCQTRFW